WKTGEEINYQYAGGYHKNRLGNYYLYYDGPDDNGDGIGEKPQILNGETDNYPLIKSISNYEILTEEPDWTFAVLTDLHIGWGIPDYGKPGYNESDNEPGQDYYMTDRLNKAVEWINAHAVSNNIKFVTVLGDITDTAEYSEFLKARQILNQLVVPYIPIIGNHDIWPYTSSAMYSPDTRAIPFTTEKLGIGETASPQEKIGDGYFEQVFWQENQLNVNKINALFPDFSRETFNVELENYSFEYRGTKFISLDFASRDQKTQLFDLLNATDIEATVDYLKQQLTDCGDKKIVLLTHFPFKDMAGGFQDGAFLNIDKALIDSNCNFINFAGHSHNNKFTIREVNGKKYPILETEAISQAKFLFESAENKFLRIITPNKWTNLLTDNYDNFVTVSSSAINPYITMFPAEVVPFQTSVFVANSNNKPKDQIESYTWQFDDDEPFTTANDRVVKYISQTGQRKIKLTVKDTSGNTESLAWNFSVIIDTRPGKKVIMIGGTLIPVIYTGVDLRDQQYAQNTKEWVFVTNNDHKLLGAFDTHFELAKTDIDLSDLAADLDASQRAAFMHMENWPKEIENSKILYIPSTGKGQVYICPQADSLDKVKPDCQDATVLTVGETKNGMTVSEIDYNGQLYYQVYGITGTGGGELDLPANSSLESQIQITKLEYDGEDILNQAAADLGDKRLPLLLSELKQDKINLTSYLPENKKKLNPWQKKKLNYKLKFLETIGNEWQGKKIKIWFNFEASQ
ncbi:MAG: metallophosphoesterase, partial [Candidatus Nealsonbacteria bacterium]|nr:metallophosphoesterase [Candidatus Nealsonbacteria bacterium]